MACYKPLNAWLYYSSETKSRQVSFGKRENWDTSKALTLPCGRCIGCRLDRSAEWATRLMHEASLHSQSSFLTLTYDEKHIPSDGSLKVEDFQKFMKRLRKECGPLKYFHCGEYGERTARPHYHCILFGEDFSADRTEIESSQSGHPQFISNKLDKAWKAGRATISEVTFESAAYVARYSLKKVHSTKDDPTRKEDHYRGRKPEYVSMSNGIGKGWLEKYGLDNTYNLDRVISRGVPRKPPAYYDKILKKSDESRFDAIKRARLRSHDPFDPETSPKRLFARMRQKEATIKQTLKREVE